MLMPHQLLVRRVRPYTIGLEQSNSPLGKGPISLGTRQHRGEALGQANGEGQMAVGIATNDICQSDKAENTSLSLTSPKITLASIV